MTMARIGFWFAAVMMTLSALSHNARAANGAGTAREELRACLDLARSKIILPGRVDIAPTGEDFSPERFLASVESLVGEELPSTTVDASGHIVGENATRTIDIDTQRRRFILRDLRDYPEVSPDREAQPEALLAATKDLLRAIGENDPDSHAFEVRYLGASVKERGGGAPTVYRVARKIFVQRLIANRPVLGDRIVFTFGLDGRFRKMLGQWRRLDLTASRLTTQVTEEQFIEAALDSLVARGIEADPDMRIVLQTVYTPEAVSDDTYMVRLEGMAKVRLEDMAEVNHVDGSSRVSKIRVVEFEL